MPKITRVLFGIALAVGLFGAGLTLLRPYLEGSLYTAAAADKPVRGHLPAPDFPAGLDWLNTGGKALHLADLKGKVVLLDFWTYGCINCMHIIPDLKRLEAKYKDSLVVIGVHSAKFSHEGQTDQIRQIVQRYGLEHPVVNDVHFQIWKEYDATGWPTLVVIDPGGDIVGGVSGEGHYRLLDNVIGKLVTTFAAEGKLSRKPLHVLKMAAMPDTRLLFPGKVLADDAGKRLFIADSSHNRIVETSLDGRVRAVIGAGKQGLQDGGFGHAEFHQPQGLTLAGPDTLYVADTGNNAIRKIDLKAKTVVTVAGNGRQGYMTHDDVEAKRTSINSPWAVLFAKGTLYVAMAGQHQLWRFDPSNGRLTRFAGTGEEGIHDAAPLDASMAQPSGLTTDGTRLFVADPEASAIREVSLDGSGRLTTLVGTGLFNFGDRDGTGGDALLQHALGVAWSGGKVYIADTYNSKIKVLDPATRTVTTLVGGKGEFDEPGGLSVAGDTLYVADTDHNRIATVNLKTGEVNALKLDDPNDLL